MKGTKNIIYMAMALGMLLYAVPRLDIGSGLTLVNVFGVVWILFALMIVAAHLHEILGVDEEMKREMGRVKRMKAWQLEKLMQGKRKMLQFRK
jgi:hypothetical protein